MLALARDFLMACKTLNDITLTDRSGGPFGAGFSDRAAAHRAQQELFRRAWAGFTDGTQLAKDFVHVDDVAAVVVSREARGAIHRDGERGLHEIAELIRRRDFPRGRD
jgi:hypothetical protein